MPEKNIYIVGAGGHTRSVIALAELCNYKIHGILDKNFIPGEVINGYPLIGTLEMLKSITTFLVLSIGNNKEREDLFRIYNTKILSENLIHPSAIIEKRTFTGKSNQIFSGVYINSNTTLGDNNIINTGCIIEHEAVVGSHNHLSVGSIICGRVNIGNGCFIGAGAVIIDKITICDNVTIGANSVVIRNIAEPGTYVGNPVKKIS